MCKPRIYIAGRMRGIEDFNFPAFDAARDHLTHKGWHVISPADIDRLYEGWGDAPPPGSDFSSDESVRFIRRDIDLLLCLTPARDAIYLLDGWEYSKGARIEKAVAEFRGLLLFYEP